MDPMTMAAVSGAVSSIGKGIGGIFGARQQGRMAALEISRLQRNQRMNNDLMQTNMQQSQYKFGEELSKRLVGFMRGDLTMSGSALEAQAQNAGMGQLELETIRHQTYLNNLQLQDNIDNAVMNANNARTSAILGTMGALGEGAASAYTGMAKRSSGGGDSTASAAAYAPASEGAASSLLGGMMTKESPDANWWKDMF